jgi:hypothetical protein
MSYYVIGNNSKWLTLFRDVNQFIAFRIGVLFSTTFIFFVSSSLVSYILRETQERMLKFTYLLQYHITRNLPYRSLIFTHVTESLVFVPIITGIYFFMFEFFSDQLVSSLSLYLSLSLFLSVSNHSLFLSLSLAV